MQDQVEVEVGQQLGHGTVNLYTEEAGGLSSILDLQKSESRTEYFMNQNICLF